MNYFDSDFFLDLSQKARVSERLRTNFNIHTSYEDPCQRVVIAMEPGSYIQPHRHITANKTETFILLKGRVVIVQFNDLGEVINSRVLSCLSVPGGSSDPSGLGGCSLVEVGPAEWHSVFALESGSVFLETKQGPFSPTEAKDFAPFAPSETDPEANKYLPALMAQLGYCNA